MTPTSDESSPQPDNYADVPNPVRIFDFIFMNDEISLNWVIYFQDLASASGSRAEEEQESGSSPRPSEDFVLNEQSEGADEP